MANAPVAGTVNINPATAFFYTGDTGTFTGTVNGGGSVTFTATGGTITNPGGVFTAGSASGDFTVTATNAANPAQTAVANITVAVPIPVSFSIQPQSLTAALGHKATFTVKASGSGTLTYQWKKGGVAIPGATSATYVTPTLTASDAGIYLCEVTGRAGMAASNPATLTVSALGTATTVTSTTVTAIPDATTNAPGAPVDIPFVISGVNGNVGEVTFSLYLTHTYAGDLIVTLLAPDNSSVALSRNAGTASGSSGSPTGAAFGTSCGTYTVFSDLGAASIHAQASPPAIVGTFRPSSPLNAFNGKAPNGTWTLRIQDVGPADIGSFQCGALSVKPFAGPSLDLNADGTVDLRDLLFLAQKYGTATPNCDLNSNGTVGDDDLTILLAGL